MEYVSKFEEKHELKLQHIVSEDLMGILFFGDVCFFRMEDIIYDIDHKLPKNLITDWMYESLEDDNQKHHMNFRTYARGLRYKDLKK